MEGFLFDISHYRELNNYNEKRIYINECFWKASKISDEYFINECEYIIIQIRNYCWMKPIINGVMIETSIYLSFDDSQIYNYVLNQQKYQKELIELQTKTSANISTGIKTNLQGFHSYLTLSQIETLFEQLKGNYIAENTNPDHFKAIFKNEPLSAGFEHVKWILLSRNDKPHKTALREFLKIAFGKVPSQKTIDVYISDKKGNPIKLAKPKKEANTEYWTDIFKKMIK